LSKNERSTHAFIVGVGEFLNGKNVDVESIPGAATGAISALKFLLEHKDNLEAPLSTIELVLSGSDEHLSEVYDLLGYETDSKITTGVALDKATLPNLKQAQRAWMSRCKKSYENRNGKAFKDRDNLFMYLSSHGFSDVEDQVYFATAEYGLIPDGEDSDTINFYQNLVEIGRTAMAIPSTYLCKNLWVFLDICQN